VMALGGTRDARTLADQAGFGKHPPRECVRRLQVLLALKPGVLCYDRTWGFGVVKSTDVFYARVEIDFERRQAHQMSMAYAAEVVQILDDDHLLSRRHRDPAAMQALIRDNPAEVVRIALRSFGPLNVAQLQERLTPSLIPEAGWKSFWEGARKGLKSDPLVHLPAKRTDPIQLLAKAKAFDEDWVAALIAERDMEQVLAKVEALLEDPASLGSLPPNGPAAVGQRLAFVVKGASYRQPGVPVRAAMLAVPARGPAEIVAAASIARAGLAGDAMLKVLADLPARLVGPYFAFLAATDRDTTLQRLLELLPRFEVGCLSEAIAFLIAAGKEAECAALLRESVTARVAPVEFMFWVLRNPQMIEKWNLGPLSVIGELALDELEKDYSGVRLRAQNQLRERFEQKEWLKACFSDMRDAKRREMLQRIRGTPAWPAVDRQSVMGHIVKLFPELADVLVSMSEARPGARGPVTSERTYRERQALLEKIANVEIPRIAREIGVARSYGDLRENFEFKAAKEQQGLLLRRKAELEQMLHDVRPTDFSGLPTDKAGLATAGRLA